MRDYAEIVHNLRCCGVGVPCDDCTYQNDMMKCGSLEGQAANAIEELLAAVPHWISVEERLPEKRQMVLVAYDNGVVAKGKLFLGKFSGANFGFDENDEPIVAEVTHWMPLPEPPKEVER